MSNFELALWSFPVLLILIFIRIPIALAMLAVGFGGSYLVLGSPLMMMNQLKTLTYGTFSNYSYSIIPLFLLMGQFATLSGMSASLFRAAESFLGHRRGGWRCRPLALARALVRFADRRWQRRRQWGRWPCRNCAATAIPDRCPPARWRRGHAGHPDPAFGDPGDLCDPCRAEH